jgi:hypothetical protein
MDVMLEETLSRGDRFASITGKRLFRKGVPLCAAWRLSRLPDLLVAAVVFVLVACDSPSLPSWRVPAELQPVRGDTQVAVVGQALADSLSVRVLNRQGEPVAGAEVEFVATAGGGTVSPRKRQSDARGIASGAWTLGSIAGVQTVEVRVPGSGLAPVVFTARARPAAAVEMVKVSGDEQTGTVGEALPQSLVVQVRDALGNPVPGIEVRWITDMWGGGSVTPESVLTDEAGRAEAEWTLGTAPGDQGTALATIETDSAYFRAMAVPGQAVRIEVFADADAVLHPVTVGIQAHAWDRFNNLHYPVFTWTSSNPAVAVIEPDTASSYRANISTRAEGSTLVSASSGEATRSISFRVAAVQGPYRSTHIGRWPALALNDRGEVVGPIGPSGVAVWRDGQTVYLAFPHPGYGGGQTAEGINNTGAVLVFQRVAGHTGLFGIGNSAILKGGVVTPIPRIFGEGTTGLDINDNDAVVGFQMIGREPFASYYGFLWMGGEMTRLDHFSAPGGQTYPIAINNRTQVAVNMTPSGASGPNDPQASSAFVWDSGVYTSIPRPDAACLGWVAAEINDHGHVLLNCGTGGSAMASFLWDGAVMTPLAPLTDAAGVNDRAEVVGWGADGLYLWRQGAAIRILDLPRPHRGRARINNVGQILLSTGFGSHLLTPYP